MKDLDTIAKLMDDKKAAILRIAAEEFARCGYDGASTNTITQRAGISKGILFHYFGSKKQLYLLILKGMVDRFAAAVERQTGEIAGDSLYENMSALFRSKSGYMAEYPLDMAFMEKSNQETNEEIRNDIRMVYGQLAATMHRQRAELAQRSIRSVKLRDTVTEAQAMECITMSLDALNARFAALYKVKGSEVLTKPELILDTMRLYLDVVCRGLFQE